MRAVRSVARFAPVVVLACVLAACSSGTTDAGSASEGIGGDLLEAVPEQGAAPADFSTGYPMPDCSAAGGELCFTNGFDPSVDGFGFANWGESGSIGATEMIALFGRKRVCASGSSDSCVLYPAAQQWADQINESMAGGHCEGMAVLSTRLFLGDEGIDELDPSAVSTFDLDPAERNVTSAIELWFATQYLEPVVSAYRSYQELTPTEIASALIDGLGDNTGYTMGIYSQDGGHAVTPLGVSLVGDQVAISIYDNNYPGTVQRVMIDPENETWSYAGGTTEPDAPTNGWGGGTGTIELTPMESRALPAPAPFSDKGAGARNAARNQSILVTSPDPQTLAGAVLEIDGETFDLTDPSVSLPDGVHARTIRSGTLTSGSTVVDVDPALVSGYAISATTQNPAGTTVPVTISIDSVGQPRIAMQADSASTGAGGATFSVDRSGAVTARSAESAARVSVANGLSGATFDLAETNALTVETDDEGVAVALLTDEEGDILATYEVDSETEDGRVALAEIVFDDETGEFEVTEVAAEPEEIDAEFLAVVDSFTDDGGAREDAGTEDGVGDDGADGGAGNGDMSGDSTDAESDAGGNGDDSAGGAGGGSADESMSEDPAGGSSAEEDQPVDDGAQEVPADEPPARDDAGLDAENPEEPVE